MGASKELFTDMREKEMIVNTTFKIKGKYLVSFEDELRSINDIVVIDYKTLTDTQELYNNDIAFKKLVKAESEAKKRKEDYIIKHT